MRNLEDCLKKSAVLSTCIMGKTGSVRDDSVICQLGYLPRKTDSERLAEMSKDQIKALEIITKISEAHGGLFADWTPPPPRQKTRPVAATKVESAEPTEPKLKKPGKREIKEAKSVASCINSLTPTRSELIRASTTACLCGTQK